MNRIFKICLLWLLVIAIPLQGFAAAAMVSCGSTHNASPIPAFTHAGPSHGEAMDQLHQHPQHHQHHDMAGTGHAEHDLTGAPAGHGSPDHHKHAVSSCSACSACCVGTALLPSSLTLTPIYTSIELLVVPPSPFVTGFIPSGLERPPRPLST